MAQPSAKQVKAAEMFLAQLSDAFLEIGERFKRITEEFHARKAATLKRKKLAKEEAAQLGDAVAAAPAPPEPIPVVESAAKRVKESASSHDEKKKKREREERKKKKHHRNKGDVSSLPTAI